MRAVCVARMQPRDVAWHEALEASPRTAGTQRRRASFRSAPRATIRCKRATSAAAVPAARRASNGNDAAPRAANCRSRASRSRRRAPRSSRRRQHVQREEAVWAGAQRFARARAQPRGQQRRGARQRTRHTPARQRAARSLGFGSRLDLPAGVLHRASSSRCSSGLAASGSPPSSTRLQQRDARAAQQLREGDALRRRAAPQPVGRPSSAASCIAQQRMRRRRGAEPLLVRAGEHDGGERPQHRALQRRDDDRRIGSSTGDSGRNTDSSSASSTQRLNSSSVIGSASSIALGGLQVQRGQHLPPRIVELERRPRAAGLQRRASGAPSQPARRCMRRSLSRWQARRMRRATAPPRARRAAPHRPTPPTTRRLRRSARSSERSADGASVVAGQAAAHDFSQSSQSSLVAPARAARSRLITVRTRARRRELPAGLVEHRHVCAATAARARGAPAAVLRDQCDRAAAARQMRQHDRPRCAAPRPRNRRRPRDRCMACVRNASRTARRAARRRRAPGKALRMAAAASRLLDERVVATGLARRSTPTGCKPNSTSVAGRARGAAHSNAMRASKRSMAPGPDLRGKQWSAALPVRLTPFAAASPRRRAPSRAPSERALPHLDRNRADRAATTRPQRLRAQHASRCQAVERRVEA